MKIMLTAACVAALPMTAPAQQAPTPEQLQATAVKDIGPYWNSTGFQIVSRAFQPDPLKPAFVARFQITATNPEALYVPNGDKVGPEEVLVMTLPAKTARTFYGTMNLAYSAGSWSGPVNIENPASKLGAPLDDYKVPTVVMGSDQYKQAVAQQTAFSIDARKARFQKQLDALEQTETARLAGLEASFEASLKALADSFAGQVKQEQTQIDTLQTSDNSRLATIEKTFETGLQNLNASFTDKLTRQQSALTDELAGLLAKSRQALVDQQKMVEKSWADVVARQEAVLAKLTPGLQATQDAVDAKIKLAQATVDGQKQLLDLQKQVIANTAAIATQKARIAEMEKARLESFMGSWGVNIQCDKKVVQQWGIHTTEARLVLAKQDGGLLDGTIAVIGGDLGTRNGVYPMVTDRQLKASLQVRNTSEKPPMLLAIASAGSNPTEKTFLNFVVQLNPAGVLSGKVIDYPDDCSVILSH